MFFKFHAVDVHKQFISETGFRSHFETFKSGRAIDEVAKAIFAAFLTKGRTMIDPDRREDLESKNASKWPWIAALSPAAQGDVAHVETTGQFAFGF
ncbi:stable inheritance protein [Burkholderia sp. Tr-20390]|nr:stable inheritance protein [Burkholderia sp. Tr-20390]